MSTETPDKVENVISIFDICETDTTAEEEGRWFRDIFADGSNVDVKLRRLTSQTSMNARRQLEKGYRAARKNGEYPQEIKIKILIEQIAAAVLIDWSGIFDRSKVEMPYSKETALALLTRLPAFRDTIVAMASNLDNFRIEDKEAAAKN